MTMAAETARFPHPVFVANNAFASADAYFELRPPGVGERK